MLPGMLAQSFERSQNERAARKIGLAWRKWEESGAQVTFQGREWRKIVNGKGILGREVEGEKGRARSV